MRFLFLTIAMALMSLSLPLRADDTGRCAQLFKEQNAIDSCNSIMNLNGEDLSDSDLREKISQMLFGMSATERDTEVARHEKMQREAAAAEDARLLKEDQCYRLFPDIRDRDACKTLRMLTIKERSDIQMIDDVSARLDKAPISDKGRQAVIEAEAARKKAVAESGAEREKAEAEAESKRQKAEAEITAARRKSEDDAEAKRLKTVAEETAARKKAEADATATRKKAEAEAAARRKKAEELLDSYLSQGQIGFFSRGWSVRGFGTVLVVRFMLQNNTASPKKDFVIRCKTEAASGTQLSDVRETLYESLQPSERRTFDLTIGIVHPQSARPLCSVTGWAAF